MLAALAIGGLQFVAPAGGEDLSGGPEFRERIQPLLQKYCFDCHGDGASKGKVTLDTFASDEALLGDHELWWKVLKNVRAGMMPPAAKPQPEAAQKAQLERWIKLAAFADDPANPDPGRVTVRRLNRTEYHNTLRDLLDVDFNTVAEFPADDTGQGFDNLGAVLTVSPLLLEKYLDAARTVVARAVPMTGRVPAEQIIRGREFSGVAGDTNAPGKPGGSGSGLVLSYYREATVTNVLKLEIGGQYKVSLDLACTEKFIDNQFDYNKARLVFRWDDEVAWSRDFTREGNKSFNQEFTRDWAAGEHRLVIEVQPLTPEQKQIRSLAFRIDSVTLRGPQDKAHWVKPKNYDHFFPRDVPVEPVARRQYARELLTDFARKAYRRPPEPGVIDRLVALAEQGYTDGGAEFEGAIAQAMTAVLASPRFLFREEFTDPRSAPDQHPFLDDHSLASRLSYFLWSSQPDAELLALADRGALRGELPAQLKRMLADAKADAVTKNFVGQWLQTRDIEGVPIDAREVLRREAKLDPDFERKRARWRELRDRPDEKLTPEERAERMELGKAVFGNQRPLRADLTGELRRAMRQETEKTFDYIVRGDHSLLELLDSDYTFLNERLAVHYALTNLNVTGDEFRRVTLPAASPRGGILTQGAILAVSSNPTRTSPVKRGVFILDNILGSPPAPPPPDVPALEDAAKGIKGRKLSLRETLALHREKPLCSSCHDRMDPLGLALENFNAMGMWRDEEQGQPIEPAGQLLSGERFATVQELKRILAGGHRREFYQTVTEKLLTYALGRALEYYDVATVDRIVDQLDTGGGRPSVLLQGIVGSAAFQKTRRAPAATPVPSPRPPASVRTEAQLPAAKTVLNP